MIREKIRKVLEEALRALSIEADDFTLEPPENIGHGDYTTNVALSHAKLYKLNPVELAKRIAEKLTDAKVPEISKVEVAGPGFINIVLAPGLFSDALKEMIAHPERVGRNNTNAGQKHIYEYTDPNPFKEFHIGHLMSNTIGEALSRLATFSGAEVKRACYQGDMGLNVAQAVWGMGRLKDEMPKESAPLNERITFLGKAYALGATGYAETEAIKLDVLDINRKLYAKTDKDINELYERGRAWSLESFEAMYATLGTKFDHYFFESESAPEGLKIVNEFLQKGVFEKSDGAIIFRGEKYGLHTRVYVNSEGFPTYDGKELGLAKIKYAAYPYDSSIIITANEQAEYFKVFLKALSEVMPTVAVKNKNIAHGMMKLSTGKMSSRTGNIVSGGELIATLQEKVAEKMKERAEISEAERSELSEVVAIAAIKYSILKQTIGKDIIFDEKAALSFEGDSGPYLQYAAVRAQSILKNAAKEKIMASFEKLPDEMPVVGKMLFRFPELVSRAIKEFAPQYVATYLIGLSGEFNSYYAKNKIVDAADPLSPFKVALTEAFLAVMKNGLFLLGIKVPEKM